MLTLIVWRNLFQSRAEVGVRGGKGKRGEGRGQANERGRGGTRGGTRDATRESGLTCVGTGQGWGGWEVG